MLIELITWGGARTPSTWVARHRKCWLIATTLCTRSTSSIRGTMWPPTRVNSPIPPNCRAPSPFEAGSRPFARRVASRWCPARWAPGAGRKTGWAKSGVEKLKCWVRDGPGWSGRLPDDLQKKWYIIRKWKTCHDENKYGSGWAINGPFRTFSLSRPNSACKTMQENASEKSGRHMGPIFRTVRPVNKSPARNMDMWQWRLKVGGIEHLKGSR